MSNQLNKLPMIDDNQESTCRPDEQNTASFEDTGSANWITGQLETNAGPVYQVAAVLDRKDLTGSIKARLGLGRMDYIIPPGLYAVGNPEPTSPVLVSANYKLSFDQLRRELAGLNLWILVLDTKGINVWCAAGKGSFSTAELMRMVDATSLGEIVSHRTLILPQLAAPGVSAHAMRKESGFKVVYGPVRAADIPEFLSGNNKAEPEMRHPSFTLPDRLILAPIELVAMLKPALGLIGLFFLLNMAALLADKSPIIFISLLRQSLMDFAPFFAAILIGIVLVPALLPYIPGRALAWKGWVLGVLWVLVYTVLITTSAGWLQTAAYYLAIPAITAFLGMNFTGSTTYTSLSGVVKEMSFALPAIILSASLGLIGLIAGYFI